MEKEIQEEQDSAAFRVYICLWLHMLKFSHLVPNKEENPSGKIMIMQITQILFGKWQVHFLSVVHIV